MVSCVFYTVNTADRCNMSQWEGLRGDYGMFISNHYIILYEYYIVLLRHYRL